MTDHISAKKCRFRPAGSAHAGRPVAWLPGPDSQNIMLVYFCFAFFSMEMYPACVSRCVTHDLVFEFDIRLRRTFFSVYFCLSHLQHVRKIIALERKSYQYWREKVRKHRCVTDRHDITLAIEVAFNPNTTYQFSVEILYLTH